MTATKGVKGSIGAWRARRSAGWKARVHGTLDRLADNLWWTWGSPTSGGAPRSMVLARRRDGDLVVHGPIALDGHGLDALDALGPPRYLLVPDASMRHDARALAERFPGIQVFAPRGSHAATARAMRVDGIFDDFPEDDDVSLRTLHAIGGAHTEGAARVTDAVQRPE